MAHLWARTRDGMRKWDIFKVFYGIAQNWHIFKQFLKSLTNRLQGGDGTDDPESSSGQGFVDVKKMLMIK